MYVFSAGVINEWSVNLPSNQVANMLAAFWNRVTYNITYSFNRETKRHDAFSYIKMYLKTPVSQPVV